MTIDDVAEIYLGITHTPTYVDSGVIFISAKNTSGDFLDLSDVKYISREEFEGAPKGSKPKANDVLFSRVGSNLGHPVILEEELELCTFVSLGFLRSKGTVTSNYLKHWMRDEFFARQVSEHVKGGGQPNLNTGWLKEFKIIVPDMDQQKKFDAFCCQIDKSKSHSPHLPNPPLKWYPLPKNEVPIMEEKIIAITNEMAEVLNIAQLKKLQEVLVKAFTTEEPERKPTNHEYLRLFLEAKSIEGCSPRTLQYYEVTVQHLFAAVNLPVRKMTTERMREYLSDYQQRRNCSKATIDNIRRNISSFFSWLEEEDHILKSPMRRIHKIKTKKTVKEVISDEDIEKLRDSCTNLRDLAMIDLLYSTGIRVGELVRLNIEDVNFESRECVVFGKGDKERRVYFDAKTKIHLKNYLESRRDTNRALFVSLLAPYNRLAISGVEIRLRKMGRMLNLKSIHPHKFRRTMATRAIDKGMPIEQVQKILGHSQIDTTMQYAIVNQNNVKMSHQKYIA